MRCIQLVSALVVVCLLLDLPTSTQAQTSYALTRGLPVSLVAGTGQSVELATNNGTRFYDTRFTFQLFGNSFNTFVFDSNGYLAFFNSTSGYDHNHLDQKLLPNNSTKNVITFAMAEFAIDASATINFFTTGTAPNRVMVFNFRNVKHLSPTETGNNIDVQVQLYETSNIIEIHNVQNRSTLVPHTLGIQGFTNNPYITRDALNQKAFSGSRALTNEMIRFTPCTTPNRTPTITAAPNPICLGQTSSLTATGCLNTDVVRWSNDAVGTTTSVSPMATSSFNAFCVEATGCEGPRSSNQPITVNQSQKPVIVSYPASCSNVVSKLWDRRFGGSVGDRITAAIKTRDGGYLVGGKSNSGISGDKTQDFRGGYGFDFWVMKVDANGNKLWDKRFGGKNDDLLVSLAETPDGKFLVAGSSSSEIDLEGGKSQPNLNKGNNPNENIPDFWLIKLDTNGNKIWDKVYGGIWSESMASLVVANNGKDYIMGGYTTTNGAYPEVSGDVSQPSFGSYDYWVIKVDSAGNKKWDRRFGGIKYQEMHKMLLTTDNNLLLVGISNSGASGNKTSLSKENSGDYFTATYYDYWVVKIDTAGNKLWDKTFGGRQNDYAFDAVNTADGGYLIAGSTPSTDQDAAEQPARGAEDYWLIKLDASGNKVWDKRFGSNSSDYPYALTTMPDGGYLVNGISFGGVSGDRTEASWGLYDYWLVRIDESGNKVWDKRFGGNNYDGDVWYGNYKESLLAESDGTVMLFGSSDSGISGDKTQDSQGASDFWIIKMAICQANLTSATVTPGQSFSLSAIGCTTGSVLWSDGNTQPQRVVSLATNITYTVTCIQSPCANAVSNPYNIVAFCPMQTVKSGIWNDPLVWSCGRVPTYTDNTRINAGHLVQLTSSGYARQLTVNGILKPTSSGQLRLSIVPPASLSLSGNMDFGQVMVGQTVSRTLVVQNTGNSVTITGLTLPAGFTGSLTGAISAGASRSVVISFTASTTSVVNGLVLVNTTPEAAGNSINVSATGTANTLNNGLVMHLPFSGNANDASGNSNHGIVTGPTLTADRFGNANQAYNFARASKQYISVPNSPSLDITGSGLSICAWIKPNWEGMSLNMQIVSKAQNGGSRKFGLGTDSPTLMNFELRTETGTADQNWSCTDCNLQQNVWQFVTVTYDGAVMKWYKNGTLLYQIPKSGTIVSTSTDLVIGSFVERVQSFFNGSMDEIRTYNRALTPLEVQYLSQL